MKIAFGLGAMFASIFGRAASPARHPSGGGQEYANFRGAWSANGYQVVRTASRDSQMATPGSGRQHERPDRARLLDISRELYRDNAIYTGIVNRAADYTVGNGFALQMRTPDEKWNRIVEAWWKTYWQLPELRNDKSGAGLELMVAKELFRTGEAIIIKHKSGRFQILEAEQLVGLGLQDDGIERNEFGAPVSFSIAPYREYGGADVARAVTNAAENVLYVISPDRPSSSRGIPPLTSSFSMFRRLDDIFNSEVLARMIQARLALSITKENGSTWGTQASKPDPTKTPNEADIASRIMTWDTGLVFTGKPGEKVESIDRGAPGANFEQEITPFLRTTGAAIGIPLEFIFMDWTKTNYSQSRAIIEQAQVTFCRWQKLMEDFFHRPAFNWALRHAVDAGELAPTFDDYAAHEWIKPAFPWIDAQKEAQAYGEQLDRGLTTHAHVLKSRNMDRGDFLEQRAAEVKSAIAKAKEIEAETGVKVPYQIFMGQKAETAAGAPKAPEEAQQPEPKEAA